MRRSDTRMGGGGGFGGGSREMHSITCAQCGTEAQVPFRPRGDRPVYCSDCFSRMRGGPSQI
jgi:CxxC-x17-CxxC domain-containing protein